MKIRIQFAFCTLSKAFLYDYLIKQGRLGGRTRGDTMALHQKNEEAMHGGRMSWWCENASPLMSLVQKKGAAASAREYVPSNDTDNEV